MKQARQLNRLFRRNLSAIPKGQLRFWRISRHQYTRYLQIYSRARRILPILARFPYPRSRNILPVIAFEKWANRKNSK